jgi:hypothetical protein
VNPRLNGGAAIIAMKTDLGGRWTKSDRLPADNRATRDAKLIGDLLDGQKTAQQAISGGSCRPLGTFWGHEPIPSRTKAAWRGLALSCDHHAQLRGIGHRLS